MIALAQKRSPAYCDVVWLPQGGARQSFLDGSDRASERAPNGWMFPLIFWRSRLGFLIGWARSTSTQKGTFYQ